jgi:hypothetical protein
MLALVTGAYAQEAPVAEAPAPKPERGPPVARKPGDVAVGAALGGGSLTGVDVVYYPHRHVALDLALGPRWGVGEELYLNVAGVGGVALEYGAGVLRYGPFARVGASMPVPEVFVAGGFSLRPSSRNGRHLFSIDLGPGWFLVRDLPPEVAEQPDFLLYFRLGWNVFIG